MTELFYQKSMIDSYLITGINDATYTSITHIPKSWKGVTITRLVVHNDPIYTWLRENLNGRTIIMDTRSFDQNDRSKVVFRYMIFFENSDDALLFVLSNQGLS